MSEATPAGLRTEPDPRVSSAAPAPTGPEFRSLDRQVGWLIVNRWTYRSLRLLMKFALPPIDRSGLELHEEEGAGRGMQVVRPEAVSGPGAVLLIHGGGHVIGSTGDALIHATALARSAGVPVFCPGYRLGPEDPFPAGLDDCNAAWSWLQERAGDLGIDPSRIVVGGISAGGGHAASLVQRLKDEGGTQPVAQLLIYPMLDDRTAARPDLEGVRHRLWSNRNNRFGWTSYLGQPPGAATCPSYASPARRDDLSGLPPAWIGVGSADLFLDEDREYARRLGEAGVEVSYLEVEGGIHGFDAESKSALARAFHASAADFVRRFAC